MKKDVFISYSSKDQEWADAICEILESDNLNCWIAHRDIKPGEDWADAINKAIKNSSVFVLVFSENSNQSVQVAKELTLAVNNRNIIIPFKVDTCQPSGSLEYYLSDTHWMIASKKKENTLIDLKEVVASALNGKADLKHGGQSKKNLNELDMLAISKSKLSDVQKKKIDIAFIVLAFVQIVFGFIYNANVLPHVNSINKPIYYYFMLVVFTLVSIVFVRLWPKKAEHPLFKFMGMLVVFIPVLLICRVLTLELKNIVVVDFIKNLIFISLFMPTYVSLLLTYNKVKFASIWLPLLIVPYSVLAYFVGGIKLALMTLATLTVVTILCIFKRIFSRKEDGIKSLLVVVTSMFFSTFLIVSSNKDVTMKFMAYLNPAKFENTAPILNIMENIDLVGYNITSTSLNNLGNIYSCTYAHVLDVFGLIVLVALLLIGMACGVLLIVRSLAKEEKYESLVGLLFGCLFVLQIIMGFASSFLMIPQANFGAALITNKSFEYGFVGIVYYISVIMPEKRCEFGVAEYLKNGYLVLKDVIFPKDEE